MGAWGEGLQANDAAWDAIGSVGFNVNGSVPKKVLGMLEKNPKKVADYFKKLGRLNRDPYAILGLAEYMLDSGVDLAPVRQLIDLALRAELGKTQLSSWRNPGMRRDALVNFRKRLDGEKVDLDEVAQSNEGLLVKIVKFMGNRRLHQNFRRN